jgi:hypothetical protein
MKRWLLLLSLVLALSAPALAQQPDTRPHPGSMRFNKLRIGTLTSCAPGLFVTGFDPRDSRPLCSAITLPALDPTVVTTTGAQKLTNKQTVPRVVYRTATGSPLTHAFECDLADITVLDTLAGDLTLNPPVCTGTNPEPEQEIEYRFFSSTPRAITWNLSAFCENNGIPFMRSTTGDGQTFDRIKLRRNAESACWGVIATTRGVGRGVTTLASSATYTCDPRLAESCEMQNTLTAGTGVTLAIPAVTYANGTKVLMRIRCTGTQALTLPTGTFQGSATVPLTGMTCSSNSYWTQVGFIYSLLDTRWQIYAFSN